MHIPRDQAILDAFSATTAQFIASGVSLATTSVSSISPASTASNSSSPLPSHASSSSQSASVIIVVLAFLLLSLWGTAFILFAPSCADIDAWFAYRAKKGQRKQAMKKKPEGLGEEEMADRSFVRLSPSPPSLRTIDPLPPITLPARNTLDEEHVEVKKLDEEQSCVYIEPAPAYEA
uniref:Uncharacterized protein n=1 Tax=Mycena chlorophos TaxID=658473 RepID=A0ABQ0MDS9_MYCCL|nr:predicted protein [Mycena chlorophos]